MRRPPASAYRARFAADAGWILWLSLVFLALVSCIGLAMMMAAIRQAQDANAWAAALERRWQAEQRRHRHRWQQQGAVSCTGPSCDAAEDEAKAGAP